METWISRNKRKRKTFWQRWFIIPILLVIAVGLYMPYSHPQLRPKAILHNIIPPVPVVSETDIYHFLSDILAEFRLDSLNIELKKLDTSQTKVNYSRYDISWPKDFPALWFVNRVQQKGQSLAKFSSKALENRADESLTIWLMAGDYADTIAEIELIPNTDAVPRMSTIAFVFDNFANFRIDEALALTELNIPFGFIIQPDQIPGTKLVKALESSRGQCLLKVPSNRLGWELVMATNQLAKAISNNKINQVNMRSVMANTPSLAGLYFTDSLAIDKEIVRLVLDEAEYSKLSYLYQDNGCSFCDSLAYLKGINILKFDNLVDCRKFSVDELSETILGAANNFAVDNKGVFLLNSAQEILPVIKSLDNIFKKYNVIITPPLNTAAVIDGL